MYTLKFCVYHSYTRLPYWGHVERPLRPRGDDLREFMVLLRILHVFEGFVSIYNDIIKID